MPTTIQTVPEIAVPCTPLVDALRDELLAIPEQQLLLVNIDVAAAALAVLGALPEILDHRANVSALVGEAMASCIDRLEPIASATLEAQAALQATESAIDLPRLALDVATHRDALFAEVRSLITRKHLPAGSLDRVQRAKGFRNQCMDLLQLTQLLLSHWDTVGPRVGVKLEDVREAEAAAGRLAKAVGVRNQAAQSPAAKMRQRAFTLLASTYDDVRRLVSFLRWKNGDADRIAPSLYTVRTKGRRRSGRTVSEPVVAPVIDAPVITEPVIAPSPDQPGGDPFSGT